VKDLGVKIWRLDKSILGILAKEEKSKGRRALHGGVEKVESRR
jgi:hypothetical protein